MKPAAVSTRCNCTVLICHNSEVLNRRALPGWLPSGISGLETPHVLMAGAVFHFALGTGV